MYWCVFVAALQLTALFQDATGATILSPQNQVQLITKSDRTACRIEIYCQVPLSGSSTVTVGGTSVCRRGQPNPTYIYVDSGTSIPATYSITGSAFYRIVVKEIPNSCSGTGTGGSSCGSITTSRIAGFISSPKYPEYYTNNLNCAYDFPEKSGYCGVQFTFSQFDLETSPGCSFDFLTIKDKAYCHQDLKDQTVAVETPSKLVFKTNSQVIGPGFAATYIYQENCDSICEEIFESRNGLINPPIDDDNKYKNDQHCSYIIKPKENAKCVKIMLKGTNLVGDDYVKIDGVEYKEKIEATVLVRFPEDGKPVTTQFVSDKEGNEVDGFTITYNQIFDEQACPRKRCGPVMSKGNGQLKSPDYPKLYPKNLICDYEIKPFEKSPSATIALLTKLAPGDSLKVGDITLEANKAISVDFENDLIKITFKSDDEAETKFLIMVIQKPAEETVDPGEG